ncbi:MAG: ribosomal RNA small subunit methyltransferase A [Solirubrobacteraceae bacterium]|nr:ribosomal RNA small subunit methyltransferase A [Solirubrobacteraceae bacterium]
MSEPRRQPDASASADASTDAPKRRLRQVTHERLSQFGLSPRKSLGQNFLVSDHVMAQIERFAAVTADDVVLEIGGGLGVLTEHLADVARHVHVIELDPRLAELLAGLFAGRPVDIHHGDAVQYDLGALDPAPNALIANLPYSVAATVVLRALHDVDTIDRGLVMVQKEVGVRFAARPGTKEYGLPSVIAQMSSAIKLEKNVPPSAFLPAPHVDSVLMRFTRTGPPAPAGLRRLAQAGFAHRRKALPKSLGISIGDARIKDATREALTSMGLADDTRAEQLSAEQFRTLHGLLVDAGIGGLA